MTTKRQGISRIGRLESGAAILAAARLVDTTPVKARLGAFTAAQRSYAEAQRGVDVADSALREGQVRLVRRDSEQDKAVDELAQTLAGAGQPRQNPLAAFGAAAPSTIKNLAPAAKARAIHRLVAGLQSEKRMGKGVVSAAEAAEEAAQRADAAVLAVDKLQETLGNVRRARDNIGQTWKAALTALKLGARSAELDGATGLYTALFGHTNRIRKKAVATPPTPAPAPPAVTVSTA